jgi:serine/threonine-protein kinase PknK
VRPIGSGSSAVVWQARDTEVGRDVAVKVLSGTDTSGARTSRLEQEARALARLVDVAGLCTLHEVGCTAEGTGWAVVDLAVGGTLADRAPLDDPEVARVGAAVARTLAAVHRHEVCHGDLTPSNVLFDDVGSPLLADFAMSALGGPGDPGGGLTPAFAAPERLRGAEPRPESDVFALGASLRAVRGDTATSVGAQVGDWLERCVVVEPSMRPSASELAEGFAALAAR